jgi:hypothetical protein
MNMSKKREKKGNEVSIELLVKTLPLSLTIDKYFIMLIGKRQKIVANVPLTEHISNFD